MASCGYAKLVGGICGSSADNPANVHVVQLGSCNRNTKAHQKSYDVRDSTLDSEVKLLLARAGRLQQFRVIAFELYYPTNSFSETKIDLATIDFPMSVEIYLAVMRLLTKLLISIEGVFIGHESYLGMTICSRHRDLFGIRWRSNKKTCSIPSQWSLHRMVKGERGITVSQSEQIHQYTGVLLPVASRKFLT